ncbi:MAG: hypothetical protein ABI580_12950 [Burkholderiaceae bacterium]
MKRVVVHIDRLVLNGFRREDQHVIAVGLRQELERVFADRDTVSLLSAGGNVSRLQVSGVPLENGSKPQRIGENVAQGIGKEIRK